VLPLANISFGELLLIVAEIFLFVIWIWILVFILTDLFRDHELSGWWKAVWVLFLVFIPFLTALIYLIARGHGMRDRTLKAQAESKEQFDSYVRTQAQTPGAEGKGRSLRRGVRAGQGQAPRMSVEQTEMGPIDYVLVEWPGRQPNGEAMPHLIDLVDRGLIRVIDLAFVVKDEDGNVAAVELSELGDVAELAIFEGASAGLLQDEDIATAGEVLEPGTSAALLVYENAWAAPFAAAVRRSGGQLVASGRIPVEDLIAALDAAEANALRGAARCPDY